jgi:hypothetical protein
MSKLSKVRLLMCLVIKGFVIKGFVIKGFVIKSLDIDNIRSIYCLVNRPRFRSTLYFGVLSKVVRGLFCIDRHQLN